MDLLSSDTKTLQLMMLDERLTIIDVRNTSELFGIIVPRNRDVDKDDDDDGGSNGVTDEFPEANFISPNETIKRFEQMVYHQFLIDKSYAAVSFIASATVYPSVSLLSPDPPLPFICNSASRMQANIELKPTNADAELLLFLNYKHKPLLDLYEMVMPLRLLKERGNYVNGSYNIFLGNEVINNRTGFFYLGVVEVDAAELRNSPDAYLLDQITINANASHTNYTAYESNYTLTGLRRNYSTDYSLDIYTSGCYFFDYQQKIWTGEGCYVKEANSSLTYCKCNHLTSFGSGFFVMPNSVDFSYVFANAAFADNVTIYMTILITLLIYALLLIWARVQDGKDLQLLGATPLPDNDVNDKYLYEISVYTGDREAAGTDSKVSFILSGEDDETFVRSLEDSKRKIFRRGAKDVFVMAVPQRLGLLNYLRVWHDNSGKGSMRSWFLSYIVVKDIQTKERFEFICNNWFAVEKGDGSIDRLLPVAGLDEATQFSHLFHQKSSKSLKDGHLWFSVFMRPPASRFTRVQRVSCCMALLYLSMLVNAMWYQRVPAKPRSSALEFGPFALSPEQIGVGFFSNLIVFPPTFLIVFLFRRSKLRTLRPSRIQAALQKQGIRNHSTAAAGYKSVASSMASINASDLNEMKGNSTEKSKLVSNKKKKKSLLLPYWCRYIGWFLCGLSIAVSVFFLWAYGIQFGDDKTRKWISSLIVSFFASILVTQPIKVFLTAIILSTLLKAPDSADDEDEDEEEVSLALGKDEEWLHALASSPGALRGKRKDRKKMYRPPNLTLLEKAKLNRLKEIKMAQILKEIFSYLFFLWILIVLSYGNRDPNAYLLKNALKSTFIDGTNSGESFSDVKTPDALWSWFKSTLVPELYVGRWYNTHQPYGLRGFLNDRNNRMMGFPVLRQVRIREQSNCALSPGIMQFLHPDRQHCRKFSTLIHEDRKNYATAWRSPSLLSMDRASMDSKSMLNASLTPDNSSSLSFPSSAPTAAPADDIKYEDESIDDASIVTRIPGEDFIILNPSKSSKTEWMYRKPSELDGLPFWGVLDMYSGGGYLVPLKGSRKSITEQLDALKKDSWIDSRSRAVFAEFSVYNAQVNLFAVVNIAAEFQPGGGIIPNYRIDIIRLMRYHQGFGLFVILCELTYVAFILYFTFREFKNWRASGWDYFTSYWNWAELLVISFSYVGMVLYVYRMIITNRLLRIFDRTMGNGYLKLQFVCSIDEMFGYIIAFTIFIGILKFIRLLRFNKSMGVLYQTLNQCSKDLKSFCFVFCVVFLSFVQMFYLLFGLYMQDFGSFINSAETTFGMVTGKFNFDAMVKASPLLGPVVFFVFVLIATIVLVNVFLTLIISAFETVKHDVMKQSNEYEIVDFMTRKLKEMIGIDAGTDPILAPDGDQKKAVSTEDQMNNVVNKVDQFLEFVNSVYFDGKAGSSGLERNQMRRVSSAFTRNRRYGWRKASKASTGAAAAGEAAAGTGRAPSERKRTQMDYLNATPRPAVTSILNWSEIENQEDRLTDHSGTVSNEITSAVTRF